uniref:Olfactory receptor 1G1-like n=1 Tax=Geotrypetes seraphini TaxID=260995 RepID=A0A6P8P9S4_GEOSA|nr:olfactory receptor 1G1-like [Geotrypetes seraphini]
MDRLDMENTTTVTEFLILGLSDNPKLQLALFLVFLLIYLTTLLGNLLIIIMTCVDPHLHTPMYFFLSNLSLTDICCTSNIVPKLLWILLSGNKTISYAGCIVQLYFFMDAITIEIFFLTAMAYDRYVAICHPLHYALLMNQRLCVQLTAASWIIGTLPSGTILVSVAHLSFCKSNKINHFFCDLMPLLKLSCTDIVNTQIIILVSIALIPVPAFLVTLISYIYIISAILRIRSAEGKRKAFSTCSSHLTVISVYYVSLLCIYMRPTSSYSQGQGKILSVLYTAVTPLLNPIIYSLRNKEVKNAFWKVIGRTRMITPGDAENITVVTEFIILGLSDNPDVQLPLFVVFLVIYLITLLGNLAIMVVTCADPRLHNPMYFFLSNLSFTDICCISNIVPKLLAIFLAGAKTVSYAGCVTQLFFFMGFTCTECFLLTAMAYDRYVAVCHPLHYLLIMNQKVCVLLAAASWTSGFLTSVTIMASVICLSFCASNEIDHIFCELMPLLKLSCTNTVSAETVLFIAAALTSVPASLVTFTSYTYIISAILRIRSAQGKRKAFSTCSSHLAVVSVFYVSIFCVYLRPNSTYSLQEGKIFSVVYTTITPMLNPLIYSLRNKEVKNALRKVLGR